MIIIHSYIHTYTHIHIYTYTHTHIHTYTHTHTHTTHTYTYTYTHTYIYILYIPTLAHARARTYVFGNNHYCYWDTHAPDIGIPWRKQSIGNNTRRRANARAKHVHNTVKKWRRNHKVLHQKNNKEQNNWFILSLAQSVDSNVRWLCVLSSYIHSRGDARYGRSSEK